MTVEELKAKLEASERANAAMREALEVTVQELDTDEDDVYADLARVLFAARDALSSDAGREFVRREEARPGNVDRLEARPMNAEERAEYRRVTGELFKPKREHAPMGSGVVQSPFDYASFNENVARENLSLLEAARAELDQLRAKTDVSCFRCSGGDSDWFCKKCFDAERSGHEAECKELASRMRYMVPQELAAERYADAYAEGRERAEKELDQLRAERDELQADKRALQSKVQYFEASCVQLKADVQATQAERDKLRRRLDSSAYRKSETAWDALHESLSAARAECAALRGVIQTLLSSAFPHPKEHPTMTAAWKVGHDTLRDSASIGRAYSERVERLVKAAKELRDSGYDGPFMGDVCVPLFSALKEFEK